MGRSETFNKMSWVEILAGFVSGFVGALGLGGGGVLLMYLTLFTDMSQQKAGGVNLLFFLPVGIMAIIIYMIKKQIEWKIVFKMWLGGSVGVVLGTFLSTRVDTELLREIFALTLIVFGIYILVGDYFKKIIKKDSK